jgi:hypothetical protein
MYDFTVTLKKMAILSIVILVFVGYNWMNNNKKETSKLTDRESKIQEITKLASKMNFTLKDDKDPFSEKTVVGINVVAEDTVLFYVEYKAKDTSGKTIKIISTITQIDTLKHSH